jgi:hypothetical protein
MLIEVLEGEFRSVGMSEETAAALSCELVLQHPLGLRAGVWRLTRRIAASGIEADLAQHLALVLLALESLQRGMSFERVLAEARCQAGDPSRGLAACLDAARLRHEIRRRLPDRSRARRGPRWEVAALVALGLLGAFVLLSL